MTGNIIAESRRSTVPNTKFTFELVQIFRGLAALLVIGYHCQGSMQSVFGAIPFKGIFYFGLFGVDFFFVLSGFIITYIHLEDLRHRTNLDSFFKKRFFRIYPFYWIICLVTFVFIVIVEHGKLEFADHTLSWSSGTDWLYVIRSFLLLPQPPISIVDVSWTLNFEILFYLVFGISILGGWKFARVVYWTWLALILMFSFGVIGNRSYYTGFLLSPLISEFLMGCLLAYVFKYQKIKLTPVLFFGLGAILAAGAFVYLRVFDHQLGRDGLNYLFVIGGAVLLLWGSATVDKSRKFPAKKFSLLILIGNASYSIYLTHTLMIRVLFRAAENIFSSGLIRTSQLYTSLLFCTIGLITVIIGIIVHLLIEQPLLRFTNRKFLPNRKSSDQ